MVVATLPARQTNFPRMQFPTACLLLTNLLVFQTAYLQGRYSVSVPQTADFQSNVDTAPVLPQLQSHSHAIPLGEAVALPSIRADVESVARDTRYGGQGDKPHLGGFVEFDMHGISPATWTLMLETFGVKSVLDVGCGRGISTTWFVMHGVDALCVEGSHDALEKSMLPDPAIQMVEHDFSRGPWWPKKTYDAVWCVEFLEHVSPKTARLDYHETLFPLNHRATRVLTKSFRYTGRPQFP